MHVNLNCFDYNELIAGIVEHYGLSDSEITDEGITKIFEDLSERFTQRRIRVLDETEIKMVEDFLKMAVSYKEFGQDSDGPGYLEYIAESLKESLERLHVELVQGVDDLYNDFIERYVLGHPDFDFEDDVESASTLFIEYLEAAVEDYMDMTGRRDFTAGELFILGQIENYTKPCEIVVDITVVPLPGKIVKYRDSLITFPLILIEVTEQ